MLARLIVDKIDLRLRSPHLAVLQARKVRCATAEKAVQVKDKADLSPDTRKAITNEVTTPRFKQLHIHCPPMTTICVTHVPFDPP